MRTALTLLLLLVTTTLHGQECIAMPVHTMGMPKARDLTQYAEKTIPVVFHVVHTGEEEPTNISDEQVLSQLDVLNEAFRTQAYDTKIDFCLARRDPDGNPTTGITRYDASGVPEYMADGVSNDGTEAGWPGPQMKAASGCWNPDSYLNFYIVSEINGNDAGIGVQGYAYLGPTGDCRDGVVCLYNTTGRVGELKPSRTLGWTGVHEVGHYLSLWHTFSNTSSCTSETNCSTQGDQVCDTPPTIQGSSCEPECAGSLVDNFMDYTPEECKFTFTEGQAERMHSQLEGSRALLPASLSCLPVVDYDAALGVAYYQEQWCQPTQDIAVQVINQGVESLDTIAVTLTCNETQYTQTLLNTLPSESVTVLFAGVYVASASTFEVSVSSPLDEYPANDVLSWPLQIVDGDLLEITVTTDIWAHETSWEISDSEGVIVGDSDYPSGSAVYEYAVCVFDECYDVTITDDAGDGFCSFDIGNDGVCDIGLGSFLATIEGDTVIWTGEGTFFDVYTDNFCHSLGTCAWDFDGNGIVGNGDLLIMLTNYGCAVNCEGDTDGNGAVDINDILNLLSAYGSCPPVVPAFKNLTTNQEMVFDLLGRPMERPLEELPQGVYIIVNNEGARKVFVQ